MPQSLLRPRQLDWRTLFAIRLFFATSSRLVSFVGMLSVGGLVVAVAVLVTVLSVVNGFDREFRERVLAVIPHGVVAPRRTGGLADWKSLASSIAEHPGVVAASPLVEGSGILVQAGQLRGVIVRGIDPELEARVSRLHEYVRQGSMTALNEPGFNTVIGSELAADLDVSVGDEITLVLPEVRFSLAGASVTTRKLTVAGIFEVGADIDGHQILLGLDAAMRLKRQDRIDGMSVRTRDLFEAPRILLTLAVEQGLYAESWARRQGALYDAIQTQKATLALLLMILVAVAAFNLVSNLVMTVDDNRFKIAILRTMGASSGEIRAVFLLHGALVGAIGIAAGVLVGILFTHLLGRIFELVTGAFGIALMDEYFIRHLPYDIRLWDVVAISLVAFVICLVATLYPASKAARAHPVEVLAMEV